MATNSDKVIFKGSQGVELAALLNLRMAPRRLCLVGALFQLHQGHLRRNKGCQGSDPARYRRISV